MQDEIWKDVEGYEGLYQASTWGRIKSLPTSLPRIYSNRKAGLYRTSEKILKTPVASSGYAIVTLCKDGIQTSCSVHRLIAETFLTNPNNYPVINHKDTNRINNNLANLEWCTYSRNNSLPFQQGRRSVRGSDNNTSKLDELQVLTIKLILAEKSLTPKQIAKYFSVSPAAIYHILKESTWSHIKLAA